MKAIDTTLQSGFDSQLNRMLCGQIQELDGLQLISDLKGDSKTLEATNNLKTFLMMTLVFNPLNN